MIHIFHNLWAVLGAPASFISTEELVQYWVDGKCSSVYCELSSVALGTLCCCVSASWYSADPEHNCLCHLIASPKYKTNTVMGSSQWWEETKLIYSFTVQCNFFCTFTFHVNFQLLSMPYTSTPLHLGGKYCSFYSTAIIWLTATGRTYITEQTV